MTLSGLLNMKSFYFTVNMLLPVYAYVQDNSQAFGYNNLDVKGFRSCLQRSRCSQITNTTFEEMTCRCDPQCAMFGDCCIDAVRPSSKRTLTQTCKHFGDITNEGIYMINSCPSNYAGPEEIRRLCVNDDFSDIAKSAPVTDFANRKIYLNRYCAICSEVPFIFIKAWSISACKVENSSIKNISLSDVIYHPTEKKWGYELHGRFHLCKFVFDKPPSTPPIGRSCRLDYISSCPIAWTEENYRKPCESYIAVVKDFEGNLYKNPHCAICNGVTLSDMVCLPHYRSNLSSTVIQTLLKRSVNRSFGLNVIYDKRDRLPTRSCRSGQIYDPEFRKCRIKGCAFPGYSIKNDKCVKET